MADARVQVPAQVRRGESFEVKILIRHAMETGYRLTDEGKPIARNVIRELTCRYNGVLVFRAEPSSGIAANPLFTFFVTAGDSGELVFEWVDDAGARASERASVTVAP
ncbi:MAG: thiosulfate oxidation carrier complex protein SoxZ [Burkholderiales bacterium]|nr:thiosulfate oxidation carrier complex protein SoxZ [Burkholderiales bacterium]